MEELSSQFAVTRGEAEKRQRFEDVVCLDDACFFSSYNFIVAVQSLSVFGSSLCVPGCLVLCLWDDAFFSVFAGAVEALLLHCATRRRHTIEHMETVPVL